jgi:hypothetical protein
LATWCLAQEGLVRGWPDQNIRFCVIPEFF